MTKLLNGYSIHTSTEHFYTFLYFTIQYIFEVPVLWGWRCIKGKIASSFVFWFAEGVILPSFKQIFSNVNDANSQIE